MRITSKGQVTIPIEYREKFGLLPNTEAEFIDDGESLRIVPAKTKPVQPGIGKQLVERLRGSGTANLDLTTDEIMALLRGP
ncbi:MAG: AbrB/MazE/SpoVT family DNA-binding domain-containing protein [Alphaproteobacteria bacterium]